MANINNPKQLKDHILRRLGAPVINVEVTEDQIYDCIQRTLEYFGEYHFESTNKSYAFVKLDEHQAKTGMIQLPNAQSVVAITRIIRTNDSCLLTFGGTPYGWISDFILTLSGSPGAMSGNTLMSSGLSMISSVMSYVNLLKDLLSPLPDYEYNAMTGQLRIFGQFQEGDYVLFEVMVQSFVDLDRSIAVAGAGFKAGSNQCGNQIVTDDAIYDDPTRAMVGFFQAGACKGFLNQSVYGHHWVMDYSTALVKELNGQILAKHQGMQLPGGVTIDGIRLIEEAKAEQAELIQELYLLIPPAPIIYG